jgi:hypothetical protein
MKAVAYANVDCAVAGPGFYAASTPQLDTLLKEVAREVSHILWYQVTYVTLLLYSLSLSLLTLKT